MHARAVCVPAGAFCLQKSTARAVCAPAGAFLLQESTARAVGAPAGAFCFAEKCGPSRLRSRRGLFLQESTARAVGAPAGAFFCRKVRPISRRMVSHVALCTWGQHRSQQRSMGSYLANMKRFTAKIVFQFQLTLVGAFLLQNSV